MERHINDVAIAAAIAFNSVPLSSRRQLYAFAHQTDGNTLHNRGGSSGSQA
jgi:hypothetical protein